MYTYIYVFFLSLDNHTVENAKKDEIHHISTVLCVSGYLTQMWRKQVTSFALYVLELQREVLC